MDGTKLLRFTAGDALLSTSMPYYTAFSRRVASDDADYTSSIEHREPLFFTKVSPAASGLAAIIRYLGFSLLLYLHIAAFS